MLDVIGLIGLGILVPILVLIIRFIQKRQLEIDQIKKELEDND